MHLLAQRLGALRLYHAGPVPSKVLEQMRRLDTVDQQVRANFSTVVSETPEQQRRNAAYLEPLQQKIQAAVKRSKRGRACNDDDGVPVRRLLGIGEGEPSDEESQTNEAIERLVASAVRRDAAATELKRFAFRRLRALMGASNVREAPAVPAIQGVRVRKRVGAEGAMHAEDACPSGRASSRATLADSRAAAHDALVRRSPAADDFVGAVAWSYSATPSARQTPATGVASSTPSYFGGTRRSGPNDGDEFIWDDVRDGRPGTAPDPPRGGMRSAEPLDVGRASSALEGSTVRGRRGPTATPAESAYPATSHSTPGASPPPQAAATPVIGGSVFARALGTSRTGPRSSRGGSVASAASGGGGDVLLPSLGGGAGAGQQKGFKARALTSSPRPPLAASTRRV